MTQHDMNIDNQDFPSFRSDLNNALKALASISSGATEPSTRFPNQLWADTTANLLKIRNTANTAWISLGPLDGSHTANTIRGRLTTNGVLQDLTASQVKTLLSLDASGILTALKTVDGTGTGLDADLLDGEEGSYYRNAGNINAGTLAMARLAIATQAEAESGTSSLKLMTPQRVKQFVDQNSSSKIKAFVNFNGIGTVSVNSSYNVSSITDNGTGDYTINFSEAIEDDDYAVVFGGLALAPSGAYTAISLRYNSSNVPLLKTTSAVRIATGNPNLNSRQDQNQISVVIAR